MSLLVVDFEQVNVSCEVYYFSGVPMEFEKTSNRCECFYSFRRQNNTNQAALLLQKLKEDLKLKQFLEDSDEVGMAFACPVNKLGQVSNYKRRYKN